MAEGVTTNKSTTILGILAIILGMLCMMMPGLTGLSVMTMIGFFVLAGGILRMFWAFTAGSLGKGMLSFLLGGLTLFGGILLLAHPLLAAGVLTIVLALYFIFDGIGEMILAFILKPGTGWGWLLFGGIVSILLGIIIWRQFPLSGVFAIGILFGIKLFFNGLLMVTGVAQVQQTADVLDSVE
jgi:uncharacterized membrane protein HdeD (DUF308 family)